MKKNLISLQPIRMEVRDALLQQYDSTDYRNTSTISLSLNIDRLIKEYLEQNEIIDPTIYITAEAYTKMVHLIKETTTELGWYGTVTTEPNLPSTYIIDDILVYPQTVTGVTCEQDESRMFEFEMSLTTDQVNHKRFHGHSHVNMGVTPSAVDENFYSDILTQVNDFFIILIGNKRGDYTLRFYDVEHNIVYDDLKLNILTTNGTDLDLWYTEQIPQLKTKEFPPAKSNKTPDYWDKIAHRQQDYNPYQDYEDFEDFYSEYKLTTKRKGNKK